ncbi:MAG: PilZ domain-containing protein [Gammaproteobacteria bacterium]|nr:PilZ domain-containing protein [Gammaproteobacteria bacterium]
MSTRDATRAQLYEDRRKDERLPTSLTVEIRRQRRDREAYDGEVLDLSRGGLGLRLDRRAELQVRWACQASSSKELDVLVQLPGEAGSVPVEARCRVVWSRDAGDDRSCMGLEVIEFLGTGQETLEAFLAANLK